MSVFAGVDIGARSVDVVSFGDDRFSKPKQYKQSPDGHHSLIRAMKKLRPKCIVMEATGVYYFDLAVALVGKHGTRINLISQNSNLPPHQALPRNPFPPSHLCVLFQPIQRTQCNGLPLSFRPHMG